MSRSAPVHLRRDDIARQRTKTCMMVGGIALLALLLSGCSPTSATGPGETDAGSAASESGAKPPAQSGNDDAADDDADAGGAAAGAATFSVGGREFAVELSTCSVYDDGAEVLLSGRATEVGGDATGFLDGDLTTLDEQAYGEFRIDLGASGPFESMDEFISMGDPTGGDISFEAAGANHVISAKAWNHNGDDLGKASIAFTC